uniref:Si:ch211-201h21.5 n=2 Tax=Cyprinus carpio TaxID=7962 RepID=A0A8C1FD96_CYPCA
MAQKLLIIDTDCGIDDALAAPGVKVLGITCCFGNTDVDNVCQNVIWVLTVCQQTQIPGSAGPLIGPVTGFKDHFGTYGLGDVLENSEIWKVQIQKEHAVHALIRLVNENQGEVSLIALGPLINLALTVRLDPTLPQKLKDLYIIGGNMEVKKMSCSTKTGHLKWMAANCTFHISDYDTYPSRDAFYRASSDFCSFSRQGKSDTRFVDPANTLKKDHLVFVMRTCYLKKFSCMLKEALQIA